MVSGALAAAAVCNGKKPQLRAERREHEEEGGQEEPKGGVTNTMSQRVVRLEFERVWSVEFEETETRGGGRNIEV